MHSKDRGIYMITHTQKALSIIMVIAVLVSCASFQTQSTPAEVPEIRPFLDFSMCYGARPQVSNAPFLRVSHPKIPHLSPFFQHYWGFFPQPRTHMVNLTSSDPPNACFSEFEKAQSTIKIKQKGEDSQDKKDDYLAAFPPRG